LEDIQFFKWNSIDWFCISECRHILNSLSARLIILVSLRFWIAYNICGDSPTAYVQTKAIFYNVMYRGFITFKLRESKLFNGSHLLGERGAEENR
jgi:hypothetical protein